MTLAVFKADILTSLCWSALLFLYICVPNSFSFFLLCLHLENDTYPLKPHWDL